MPPDFLKQFLTGTLSRMNVGLPDDPTFIPMPSGVSKTTPQRYTPKTPPAWSPIGKALEKVSPPLRDLALFLTDRITPSVAQLEEERQQSLVPEFAEKELRKRALEQGFIKVPGQEGYFDITGSLTFGGGTLARVPGALLRKFAGRLAKTGEITEVTKLLRSFGLPEARVTELAPRLTPLKEVGKIEPILAREFGEVTAPIERGFIRTARESPVVRPEVARSLDGVYDPLFNRELVAQADRFIAQNTEEALRVANTQRNAFSNVLAQRLVVNLQNQNRYEEAINLIEKVAKTATSQGQAIQALSIFNRLTPDGILRFAQRELSRANTANPRLNLKLTPAKSKELVAQARKAEALPAGREKVVETARLLQKIQDMIPASLAQKVSFTQTLAQLLNPKTFIRNLGGNLGFAAFENISDVAAVPFDSALSLFTGRRSVAFPSLRAQFGGFKKGFSEGLEDALNKVETNYLPTQFELPKSGVFKGKVGQALEKLLNFELRVPDRAFYKAAYDGSLYQQMKAAKVSKPTDEMIERAHYEGLYKTFQDDSLVSQLFVKIKRALNLGRDFGVGDIVLKYPRTPGNLLSRGIEYSPGGMINVLYEAAKPMIGKPFNQRQFVQSFSRAITGTTALTGLGAFLHHIGIITAAPDEDRDVRALQRTVGVGQYRINASALKRLVMSGFDVEQAKLQKGDKLVTYDWFQPQALPITIGANLDDGASDPNATSEIEAVLSSLAEGVETLAEQPLVRGLKTVTRPEEITGMVAEIVKSAPASFIPTFVSQINQLIDNTQRSTYSPEVLQYATNLAKAKIPGAAQTLEPTVSVFGEDLERYQGKGNNLFNVFFNPAFTSTFTPTPEAQMVLDLIQETGETTHVPRVISYSQTINGEKKKLTPTQVTAMQRFVGTRTRSLFNRLAQDKSFQSLEGEDKVKYLQELLTDIGSAGKILILGNRPKRVDKRTKQIIQGSI